MLKKLLALLILGIFLLGYTQVGRSLWQAALVLPNLVPENTYRPLEAVTEAPTVKKVEIPFDGHTMSADLYLPADEGKIRKVLLLISGASLLGKDDPRIVNFGKTLSRVGMAVLIPNFDDITFTKISPQSVDEVSASYSYLLQSYPGHTSGMAAFSVATGPMFLASTRADLSGKMDYLISFGGYYDLKDVIRAATTGPHTDPTLLPEISSQFNSYFGFNSSFKNLLDNSDPAKFDDLYNALTPDIKDFITTLSPSGTIAEVKSNRVFLIHSDPDPDVPTIESEKLKDALGARADLVILKSFSHTDVKLLPLTAQTFTSFYVPEIWKLYKIVFKVLSY